jgi:hypothetical protein
MSIETMKVEGPLHVVCQCDKCKAEKQEQGEPVIGTKTWFEDGKVVTQNLYYSDVYATPRQRKPLTDEQIDAIWDAVITPSNHIREFVRAIEAEHGIKE